MRRFLAPALALTVVLGVVLTGAPAGATTPTPAPGYAPGTNYWGVLQVAYRRPDGGITYDSGGQVNPTDLGGTLISGPSTMAFTAPATPTRLWVAATGTNKQVYYRHQTSTGWTPWTSYGGATTGTPALACFSGGGYAVVFVRGTDNALWRRVLDYPNSWRRIGGTLSSSPSAMTPTSGQCPLGEGEIVAVTGGDKAIYELRYEQWHRIGGRSSFAPAVMYSPKSASVHVFVVGTDRALWTASRTGAGAWSGFTRIGGVWTSAPSATEIPSPFDEPGTFAVVALGANGQLYRASAPIEGGAPWTFTHLP